MASPVRSLAGYLFIDLVGSVVRFPVWWYSRGFLDAMSWFFRHLSYTWQGYAVGLWIKQFFVPMYGSFDWAGRIISVFARFFVIIGRSLAFGVEALFAILLMFVWLLLPLVAVFFLLENLSIRLLPV